MKCSYSTACQWWSARLSGQHWGSFILTGTGEYEAPGARVHAWTSTNDSDESWKKGITFVNILQMYEMGGMSAHASPPLLAFPGFLPVCMLRPQRWQCSSHQCKGVSGLECRTGGWSVPRLQKKTLKTTGSQWRTLEKKVASSIRNHWISLSSNDRQ